MDTIADMITQLRNAGNAGKPLVRVPFSRHVKDIADTLVRHGYVEQAQQIGEEPKTELEITLAYDAYNRPVIKGSRRVSKLSRRVYEKAKNIDVMKRGYGHRILTTPSGVLSDDEARDRRVGGEVLFEIW